jgi:hypothetical protein
MNAHVTIVVGESEEMFRQERRMKKLNGRITTPDTWNVPPSNIKQNPRQKQVRRLQYFQPY